jgi:hypothetical protein
MKKLLLALSMILTIGLSATPANDETKVDPRVISAFQKEFWFAKNANWDVSEGYTRVRFSLNDQGFIAWYNTDAELVRTARNILYMQLPLSVIKSLEEKFGNADLLEITEVTKDNITSYYLQVEENNKKYSLEASPSGSITIIKKTKK